MESVYGQDIPNVYRAAVYESRAELHPVRVRVRYGVWMMSIRVRVRVRD